MCFSLHAVLYNVGIKFDGNELDDKFLEEYHVIQNIIFKLCKFPSSIMYCRKEELFIPKN